MSFKRLKTLLVLLIIVLMTACNYNSNIMMKTAKNYKFNEAPSDSLTDYIVTPSDIIEFKLYTNDGSLLVDFTAIREQQTGMLRDMDFQYLVESNGEAKLPILGRVGLKDKTIKEVEALLEEEYSKYYIKPFVQLRVVNKRVTVFPGGSGSAKIVPLRNENMRLLEALGSVGGLTNLAKARRIKLIRGNLKNPQVYLFDFSTIEGVKGADFVLQANDIIYVEPRAQYIQQMVRDIAPIVSLIASTVTLILVLNNINNTN